MVRTVGVEEELLLVDARTGKPRAVSGRVLLSAKLHHRADKLQKELQEQMLETGSEPCADMQELDAELRELRSTALDEAREAGAQAVATGTSPLPGRPRLSRTERYERLAKQFGQTARENLTCGCHVHVSVDSDDEAIGVMDRIRVWLPVLLALSANSPFWQGKDTDYASFRSQVISRWPTAGPPDLFGTGRAYREHIEAMLATGVMLDEAMVYTDARPSHHLPTIEVRSADVCADVRDTVLMAALARGLVETAAREWASDVPAPDVSTALLRLATWRAGRTGLEGELIDPVGLRPRPAREVVDTLLEHVGDALRDAGDEDLVDQGLRRLLANGNGAMLQRSTYDRTGQATDVVAELAKATAGFVE